MKSQLRSLVLSFGLLLAAFPAAGWEEAYGPPRTLEQAYRRVAPVPGCPPFGAGHIAVVRAFPRSPAALPQFTALP